MTSPERFDTHPDQRPRFVSRVTVSIDLPDSADTEVLLTAVKQRAAELTAQGQPLSAHLLNILVCYAEYGYRQLQTNPLPPVIRSSKKD